MIYRKLGKTGIDVGVVGLGAEYLEFEGLIMCDQCNHEIKTLWKQLKPGQSFRTPDNQVGKPFSIYKITDDKIVILRQQTPVPIKKESFSAAIHYLRKNSHNGNNPCEIRSSNSEHSSRPLCSTTRQENNKTRCVNYILPILSNFNFVGCDVHRPGRHSRNTGDGGKRDNP